MTVTGAVHFGWLVTLAWPGLARGAGPRMFYHDAAPRCYLLALGPMPSPERAPIAPPSVLQLLDAGRVRTAWSLHDTLAAPAWGSWSGGDSLQIDWTPGALSGSVSLSLRESADSLLGRFVLRTHEVDDGRVLWRGAAIALRVACHPGRSDTDTLARHALVLLRLWQVGQRADTVTAVREALREHRAFLRRTPIHSLSILNYRIAEFACRNGRLPERLVEVWDSSGVSPRLWLLTRTEARDAWGMPLSYRPRPPGYEVRSAGPDRRLGTPDDLVSALDRPLRRDRSMGCLGRAT